MTQRHEGADTDEVLLYRSGSILVDEDLLNMSSEDYKEAVVTFGCKDYLLKI